ncbi:MAG: hypothetical protein DMG30_17440 [Acidobacteria bacterium]|nr:MAG: hypothetical protein DMG30_17440 [Acidobacteriota bacterium]
MSRFGFFSQFKQRAVAALNMSLGGSGCVPEHPSERARAIWLEPTGSPVEQADSSGLKDRDRSHGCFDSSVGGVETIRIDGNNLLRGN